MVSTKWIYHKERSFAINCFIFLETLFQFKNLLERVDLMYQRSKFPYSYFLQALEFYLTVIFPVSILNSEPTEYAVRGICEIYSCKNLIKDNTYFKNPLKFSCIVLIITNRPKSFQNSVTVETAFSDFQIFRCWQ